MKTQKPRKNRTPRKPVQPVADLVDVTQSLAAMESAQADAFAALETLDATVKAMPAINHDAHVSAYALACIEADLERLNAVQAEPVADHVDVQAEPVADQKPVDLATRLSALAFQLIIVCVALALRGMIGATRQIATRVSRGFAALVSAVATPYAVTLCDAVFARR